MKDHSQNHWLRWPLLAVLLLASPMALAEVYKTVDKDGNVVYTDQPPEPGAEPLELKALSIISPQKLSGKKELVPGQSDTGDGVADGQVEVTSLKELRRGYTDFAIISPRAEQSFVGTGNTASIAWSTRYRLQQGMSVTIILDGVAQLPTTSSVVTIPEVFRGEHIVLAEIRDVRNRLIARTDPVTFYMKQTSVNFPARQNSGG
jgi:hypothetical protein